MLGFQAVGELCLDVPLAASHLLPQDSNRFIHTQHSTSHPNVLLRENIFVQMEIQGDAHLFFLVKQHPQFENILLVLDCTLTRK